jgi:copper resistance protein C
MPGPSPQPSRMRTVIIVVIALFVVAAMVAPAALAHAQLLSSDPADGATLATTDQVVLTFNEEVNPDFVQIVVTGPEGSLTLDQAVVEGAVVTQPMTPLSAGVHTLTYRVVSADGHPVSGAVGFTLTDVPGPATSAGTPEPPTTPEQPTVMSGGDEATVVGGEPAVEESGAMFSPLVWLLAGAVLVALVAAGAWLARQRRHPEH